MAPVFFRFPAGVKMTVMLSLLLPSMELALTSWAQSFRIDWGIVCHVMGCGWVGAVEGWDGVGDWVGIGWGE